MAIGAHHYFEQGLAAPINPCCLCGLLASVARTHLSQCVSNEVIPGVGRLRWLVSDLYIEISRSQRERENMSYKQTRTRAPRAI